MKKTKAIEKEISKFEDVKVFFAQLKDDLQDKFDKMSEKAQDGEKGEQLFQDIDALESLNQEIENISDNLSELFEED